MICQPCRNAADRIPDAEHCGPPGKASQHCACQHRQPKEQR